MELDSKFIFHKPQTMDRAKCLHSLLIRARELDAPSLIVQYLTNRAVQNHCCILPTVIRSTCSGITKYELLGGSAIFAYTKRR